LEKIVSKPAEYKPSWFSYQGAVQGVLNSLGVDVGLADVIAVSGYGWITNAMRKNMCPSAPSAFHGDIWMGNYKATENLGYRIDVVWSGGFDWDDNQKPTPESVINAKKQFDTVKKEIESDHPVVMWGIPIPEYGIVNGYRGEEYLVSTFRSILGQPDDPIHYLGLMAPGGLTILRFAEPKELDLKKAVDDTLRRGYRLGAGDVPQIPEYVMGSGAYDVFAKNLTEEPFDDASYHGTAYTMACLMEAKWAIAVYLRKVDPVVDSSLTDVAGRYEALHRILQQCHVEFPMGPGEMKEEKCVKAAGLLREAKTVEVEALECLYKAIEV
jgi:hypothetical protein